MTVPLAGWVAPFGYPRINACSRLPMAFRSVPRPSSPPGAKASTECPSRARERQDHAPITASRPQPAPAPTPCTETIPGIQLTEDGSTHGSRSAHTSPLNPNDRGTPEPVLTHPFQPSGQTCDRTRPETHQNLIHPDKDHQRPKAPQRPATTQGSQADSSTLPATVHPGTNPTPNPGRHTGHPGGDDRVRTDDPLLAKQVLSQLSYAPRTVASRWPRGPWPVRL